MASTFATGIGKRFSLKKESTLATLPGASGAQEMRHVTFDTDLSMASQASDEKSSSYQLTETRLGMRKLTASIKGLLSGTTWGDILAAALRKGWVAGPSVTATTLSSAASAPQFNRSSGSFITDGFKVGLIFSPSGFAGGGTANNGKRYKITAVTALGITVSNIDGSTPTIAVEAAGATVTFATPGKILYVPTSAHTFDSFTAEEYQQDITAAFSHLSTGLRVSTVDLSMGLDANINLDVGMVGIDRQKHSSANYFTSPTAVTTNGIMNTVSGSFRLNGTEIAYLTDVKQKVDLGIEPAGVLFSKVAPDHFPGRVMCGGSFSAHLKDPSFFDAFDAETEMAMHYYLTSNPNPTTLGDVIAVIQPRIKLLTVTKSDAEKAIIQSATFNSHLYSAGSGIEQTTMLIQDTSMP